MPLENSTAATSSLEVPVTPALDITRETTLHQILHTSSKHGGENDESRFPIDGCCIVLDLHGNVVQTSNTGKVNNNNDISTTTGTIPQQNISILWAMMQELGQSQHQSLQSDDKEQDKIQRLVVTLMDEDEMDGSKNPNQTRTCYVVARDETHVYIVQRQEPK